MIEDSGVLCSVTGEAPCIMDSGACNALHKPGSTSSAVSLLGLTFYRLLYFLHSVIITAIDKYRSEIICQKKYLGDTTRQRARLRHAC